MIIETIIEREIGTRPAAGTCVSSSFWLPVSTKVLAQQVTKRAKQVAEAADRPRPTAFDVYAAALRIAAANIAKGGSVKPIPGTPLVEYTLVYIPNDIHKLLTKIAADKETSLQQLVPAAMQKGLEMLSK